MSRRSVVIEGFSHGTQPIPAACRINEIVMTGGIYGLDPETGKVADEIESQAGLMFLQLDRILSGAGASTADVIKMTFYVKNAEARAVINAHWLGVFPDPASRPARQTLIYEHLAGNILVQCDAIAVISKAISVERAEERQGTYNGD